ncbi:cerebellin 20 isoform X1 [Syngnathus scovelli]|uniref:cerebellin 20 isoform X1 n=1 Tax=Syngnathus scovelli TaxID=161590 RepID=UPI0021107DBA|nr:cerebellin 20 isoform X1 [Syngnathus scovelli]
MQAAVFLCLLGLVSCKNPFSWGGPSDDSTNQEEACVTDQATCGCCLMQQKIHRMKMYFNTSLSELENELTRTKNTLNNIRGQKSEQHQLPQCLLIFPTCLLAASRSAFSVALTNSDTLTCYGPFRDDKLITYQHVFINLGRGYNAATGVFTAPRDGVYSLALTVYSDAGSPGNSLAACANLQVNGQVVAGPKEKNKQDQEDSASIVLAIHLAAGDKVAVNLPIGCFLCDDKSHYNTFTGFLLYATD